MPDAEHSRSLSLALCAGALAALLALVPSQAQRARAQDADPTPAPAGARADGQRDFDLETGLWRTQVRRLAQPLSGSRQWLEYAGTTRVIPVQGGRANLAELAVAGAAGRIDGVSLRLYEPESGTWRIHYANLRDGALTAPVAGGFVRGRGEFFGEDSFDGRPIRVRFRIHCPQPDRCLFEQAFSADGGRNWETNWLATDTRIRAPAGASGKTHARGATRRAPSGDVPALSSDPSRSAA